MAHIWRATCQAHYMQKGSSTEEDDKESVDTNGNHNRQSLATKLDDLDSTLFKRFVAQTFCLEDPQILAAQPLGQLIVS
jgi:hypothetical protein